MLSYIHATYQRPRRNLLAKENRVLKQEKIQRTEDKWNYLLPLPGVTEEGLHVSIDDNTLVIKARTIEPVHGEGFRALRLERNSSGFERRVRLPDDIDAERPVARLKDGLFRLELPRVSRVQEIEVEF